MDIAEFMYDESSIAAVMVPVYPLDANAALLDADTLSYLVSEDGERLTI